MPQHPALLSWVLFFFPHLLQALSIDVPTRSSDGRLIRLTWSVDSREDPHRGLFQIRCGSPITEVAEIPTAYMSVSILVRPSISTNIYSENCNVLVYDPDTAFLIAKSPNFREFRITSSVTTNEDSNKQSTKSSTISSTSSKTSTTLTGILPSETTGFPSPRVSTGVNPTSIVGLSSDKGESVIPTATIGDNQTPNTNIASSKTTPGTAPTPIIGDAENRGRSGSLNSTVSKGAIVGGVLGAVTLISLIYVFYIVYSRHKRGRPFGLLRYTVSQDGEATLTSVSSLFSWFSGRSVHSITAYPLVRGRSPSPLRRKQERLAHIQREMEVTRRQQDVPRYDLEMGGTDNPGSRGNIDTDDEVGRLRGRIEQIIRRIRELEMERAEELPPNYYASIGNR